MRKKERPLPPGPDGAKRKEIYFPLAKKWLPYRCENEIWIPEAPLFPPLPKSRYSTRKYDYITKHNLRLYSALLRDNNRDSYLRSFEVLCINKRKHFVEEYMAEHGATDEMKEKEPLRWETIHAAAESDADARIGRELIYTNDY